MTRGMATDKKQQKRPGEGTKRGKKMVDEAIKKFNRERSGSKDSDKR